jgi:hypothetical protein
MTITPDKPDEASAVELGAIDLKAIILEMAASSSGWMPPRHINALIAAVEALQERETKLTAWVDDLQSGMYVNCVYCGHRYGPGETTPVTMADALKEHIEQCPDHPMSALRERNTMLLRKMGERAKWASDANDRAEAAEARVGELEQELTSALQAGIIDMDGEPEKARATLDKRKS